MDDTTETPAETPEPATPDAPNDEGIASETEDDTTETPAEVVPLTEITLPRRMNVVLSGVRFRFGSARARITPLQRLYLTRRGARFEEVAEDPEPPVEPAAPADTPMTEAELAEAASREAAPESSAQPVNQSTDETAADAPDDAQTEESETPPAEVPVPDETWTDEALNALGKERGITWRSNASKATKVAKLTEG
ncbi:MAG TPA: hypothetical protein VN041_18405 [Microbacterium sp.]|nr:hypothetical protein [Microbacterium sp.]